LQIILPRYCILYFFIFLFLLLCTAPSVFLYNKIHATTRAIFCDGFLLLFRHRIVSISNLYCLPFCFV